MNGEISDQPLTEQEEAILDQYHALCHAMQTGVKLDHQKGSDDGSAKHLRVGVNTAKCDHGALVAVLVNAGVIKREDYFRALRDMMLKEVEEYKKRLDLPPHVHLG